MKSFWLKTIALSSTVAVFAFAFAFDFFKKKQLKNDDDKTKQNNNNNNNKEKEKEKEKDKDKKTIEGGEDKTDLHGRPWRDLKKKSERAEWWAKHGEIDKDTLRIEKSRKQIETPEKPICVENLHEWLTVVMTTSPVTSNPNTDLINEVGKSLLLVEHLDKCPKLIICDGYKVREKNKFRSGEITQDRVDAYADYKKNLHKHTKDKSSVFYDAQILELEERNGFGYAMREGTVYVTTPYMIVVQHDRNFVRGFDLLKVLKTMRRHRSWCQYVGLPTSRTIKHTSHILSKYTIRVSTLFADVYGKCAPRIFSEDKVHLEELKSLPATTSNNEEKEKEEEEEEEWLEMDDDDDDNAAKTSPSLKSKNAVGLVPLIQWYDSTHMASTEYYRNFVFDRRIKRVSKGGFIEDKLGQQQLKLMLEQGIKSHIPYGTFILQDGEGTINVSHLDGHDPRNSARFVHVNE